jgi:hypothetical protein
MKLTDPILLLRRVFGINPKKGKINSHNKLAGYFFILIGIFYFIDIEFGPVEVVIAFMSFYLAYRILYNKKILKGMEWIALPILFFMKLFLIIGFLIGYLL